MIPVVKARIKFMMADMNQHTPARNLKYLAFSNARLNTEKSRVMPIMKAYWMVSEIAIIQFIKCLGIYIFSFLSKTL